MSEPLKAILTFDEKAGVMFVYEDAEKGMTELSAWTADMSPVGGPILGPFSFRYEALKAERDWLREERGV